MKSTVIFTDKDAPEEAKTAPIQQPSSPPDPKVVLSRDEYKEVIKEAYKEGVQDAMKEQPNPEPEDPERPDAEKSNAELQKKTPEEHPKSQVEGQREAAKLESKETEQTKRKLENLSQRQDIELMRVQGVFPFDFFPDTLIIDTTKITIVKKQMFATENIITIPLKALSDAHVQTALFLASLTVAYMPHANSPGMLRPEEEQIACLRRADAIRAKNIMKGILVAQAEEIDLAKLSPEEIVNVIEKFGENAGVT